MEPLISYFQKLDDAYKGYLKNVQEEYDEEVVHNLRITVKKIKASFFFFQFCFHGFDAKKGYQNYKEVFQRLGTIRDLQIQQKKFTDWSREYNINFTPYINYIKNEENLHKYNFSFYFKKIPLNNFRKISHRLNNKLSEHELNEKAVAYLEHIIGNIRSFDISSFHTYEEIHNLRKQFKELQYNLSMLETCLFSRKMYKSILTKLKTLTEELGNWHDNYNLLSHLFAFKLNFFRTKPKQLKRINSFEKELISLNSAQMNNLQKHFSEFCFYSLKIEKHWKQHD